MHHFKQFLLDMPAQARFRALLNVFFPDGSQLPRGASGNGFLPVLSGNVRYDAMLAFALECRSQLPKPPTSTCGYTSSQYGLIIDVTVLERNPDGFYLAFRVWDGPETLITLKPQFHPGATVCANP